MPWRWKPGWGLPRSLEMSQCDTAHMTSYWRSIVTMALSCVVFCRDLEFRVKGHSRFFIVVSAQYQHWTDRETDGRTDGRPEIKLSISRVSMLTRDKKNPVSQTPEVIPWRRFGEPGKCGVISGKSGLDNSEKSSTAADVPDAWELPDSDVQSSPADAVVVGTRRTDGAGVYSSVAIRQYVQSAVSCHRVRGRGGRCGTADGQSGRLRQHHLVFVAVVVTAAGSVGSEAPAPVGRSRRDADDVTDRQKVRQWPVRTPGFRHQLRADPYHLVTSSNMLTSISSTGQCAATITDLRAHGHSNAHQVASPLGSCAAPGIRFSWLAVFSRSIRRLWSNGYGTYLVSGRAGVRFLVRPSVC